MTENAASSPSLADAVRDAQEGGIWLHPEGQPEARVGWLIPPALWERVVAALDG